MSNKASKQPKPKKQSRREEQKRRGISLFGIVLGSATLLGGFVSILTLSPRISVSQPSLPDSSNPFASRFVVSNDGWISLHDVKFSCATASVHAPVNITVNGGTWSSPELFATDLLPARKATVPCLVPMDFPNPISDADVAVIVSFRPDFLWWRQEQKIRLLGRRMPDRSWTWEEQPIAPQRPN